MRAVGKEREEKEGERLAFEEKSFVTSQQKKSLVQQIIQLVRTLSLSLSLWLCVCVCLSLSLLSLLSNVSNRNQTSQPLSLSLWLCHQLCLILAVCVPRPVVLLFFSLALYYRDFLPWLDRQFPSLVSLIALSQHDVSRRLRLLLRLQIYYQHDSENPFSYYIAPLFLCVCVTLFVQIIN